jgi:hypothetical protein
MYKNLLLFIFMNTSLPKKILAFLAWGLVSLMGSLKTYLGPKKAHVS